MRSNHLYKTGADYIICLCIKELIIINAKNVNIHVQ